MDAMEILKFLPRPIIQWFRPCNIDLASPICSSPGIQYLNSSERENSPRKSSCSGIWAFKQMYCVDTSVNQVYHQPPNIGGFRRLRKKSPSRYFTHSALTYDPSDDSEPRRLGELRPRRWHKGDRSGFVSDCRAPRSMPAFSASLYCPQDHPLKNLLVEVSW